MEKVSKERRTNGISSFPFHPSNEGHRESFFSSRTRKSWERESKWPLDVISCTLLWCIKSKQYNLIPDTFAVKNSWWESGREGGGGFFLQQFVTKTIGITKSWKGRKKREASSNPVINHGMKIMQRDALWSFSCFIQFLPILLYFLSPFYQFPSLIFFDCYFLIDTILWFPSWCQTNFLFYSLVKECSSWLNSFE